MFSVIICTHNPDWVKFNRVLESLNAQDYPESQWEWIIVDNASKQALSSQLPNFCINKIKVVEEPEPGLTSARIAGIRASTKEWLILIDDDNVVAHNYLRQAELIIQQYPTIGAFGCALIPEFEEEPSNDVRPHLFMLAIRQPKNDVVDTSYSWESTPFGAGMVIRKSVAEAYVNLLQTDTMRKGLDRKGASLMSSGDVDLAHTAVDLGFQIGVFPSLELIHIIPSFRVQKKYLIQMMRYNALSNHLLFYIRFKREPTPPPFVRRVKQHLRFWKKGMWFESAMLRAKDWGARNAISRINKLPLK